VKQLFGKFEFFIIAMKQQPSQHGKEYLSGARTNGAIRADEFSFAVLPRILQCMFGVPTINVQRTSEAVIYFFCQSYDVEF
jgi:hypothetical protein